MGAGSGERGTQRSFAGRPAESLRGGSSWSVANDARVLGWDVWNEPSNTYHGSYFRFEPANQQELVEALLPKAFAGAREAHPNPASHQWSLGY